MAGLLQLINVDLDVGNLETSRANLDMIMMFTGNSIDSLYITVVWNKVRKYEAVALL